MEAEQARDGARYYAGVIQGLASQATGQEEKPLKVKLRLKQERDDKRAQRSVSPISRK